MTIIFCCLFLINIYGLIDIPSINAQPYETVQFVPLKLPSTIENSQKFSTTTPTTSTSDRKSIDPKLSQENTAIIRKLVEQLEHALYVQQYEQKIKSANILDEELPYLNDEYQSYQQDPYQQIYAIKSQTQDEILTQPAQEQYQSIYQQQRPFPSNHGQSLAELIANDDIRRQRYQINARSNEPSIDELFDRIIRDKPYQLETPKLKNIQEYVKNRNKRNAQQYGNHGYGDRRPRYGDDYEHGGEHDRYGYNRRYGGQRRQPPLPPHSYPHSHDHGERNGPHNIHRDYHLGHGNHHVHERFPDHGHEFAHDHRLEKLEQGQNVPEQKPLKQIVPNSIESAADEKPVYDIDVRGDFSSEILHRKRRQAPAAGDKEIDIKFIQNEDAVEEAEEILEKVKQVEEDGADNGGGELNTRFGGGGFLAKGRDAIKHVVGDLIDDFVGAISHHNHHHHNDEESKQEVGQPQIEYPQFGGYDPTPIGVGRPQIGRPDQQQPYPYPGIGRPEIGRPDQQYPNPGAGRPQIDIEIDIGDGFGGGDFQQPYPIQQPTGKPHYNRPNRPIYPNIGRPETINPRPIHQEQYPNQGQFGEIIQNPRPQYEYEQIDESFQRNEDDQFDQQSQHHHHHHRTENNANLQPYGEINSNPEFSRNNEPNDVQKSHRVRHGGNKIDISIRTGETEGEMDSSIANYFGSEPNSELEKFEYGRAETRGEYNSFGTKQQPMHKDEPDLYAGQPVFN